MEQEIINCPVCGTEFNAIPLHKDKNGYRLRPDRKKVYCSIRCRNKSIANRPWPWKTEGLPKRALKLSETPPDPDTVVVCHCGKEFKPKVEICWGRYRVQRCCSVSCRNKINGNKKLRDKKPKCLPKKKPVTKKEMKKEMKKEKPISEAKKRLGAFLDNWLGEDL